MFTVILENNLLYYVYALAQISVTPIMTARASRSDSRNEIFKCLHHCD